MWILHTGKKHTSPAVMGKKRLLPPVTGKQGRALTYCPYPYDSQCLTEAKEIPASGDHLKNCAKSDTEAKTIFRRLLKARWEEEGYLARVKNQPPRLTATLRLQPMWDAVVNRVWETGEVTKSQPRGITVLRAKFGCSCVPSRKGVQGC